MRRESHLAVGEHVQPVGEGLQAARGRDGHGGADEAEAAPAEGRVLEGAAEDERPVDRDAPNSGSFSVPSGLTFIFIHSNEVRVI